MRALFSFLTCIDFLDLFTPIENDIKDFDKMFGFFRESIYMLCLSFTVTDLICSR